MLKKVLRGIFTIIGLVIGYIVGYAVLNNPDSKRS